MSLTIDDMRNALKGQRKADEAIFWFCNMWHSGRESELYQIMVATGFFADQHRTGALITHMAPDPEHPGQQIEIKGDPEIEYCLAVLDDLYKKHLGIPPGGTITEHALQPVKLADVAEADVLTAGNSFMCIATGWPCRVFKHHGILGVACAEDHNGKQFHPLDPDDNGYVKGFRR